MCKNLFHRMSGEGKTVCVTGDSGFIASWVVKSLLQSGYTVKATVRDPNDARKTEHLRALDGAEERLQLLKADLMEEGSFDPIVHGCECVFHTASQVMRPDNPQDVIEPAVNGTLNVLRSCAKAGSVKRVVFTSSLSTVMNGKPLTDDAVIDESWRSKAESWIAKKRWYMLAKTLAEEAAWKFSKENGLDMVAMNPAYVIGPLLQSTVNMTSRVFLTGIKGTPGILMQNTSYVDVRDAAKAHVQAFLMSSASGRYCLGGEAVAFSEIAKIVVHHFPSLHMPGKFGDEKEVGPKYKVSREKARSLRFEFTPLEVTVKEAIESFVKMGFLSTEHGGGRS